MKEIRINKLLLKWTANVGVISCLIMGGCTNLPDQRQGASRIRDISNLEIKQTGKIKIHISLMDYTGSNTTKKTRLKYVLRSPYADVEDTDIRGFLDGATKYGFNQATSYHMRVGRRYSGDDHGEFELKRSLVRWKLPPIPHQAKIVSASVSFWVEQYPVDSPLSKLKTFDPLHLYLYAIAPNWHPGEGGVNKDSFSDAAPGEVSWTEARVGELSWPAPGALLRTSVVDEEKGSKIPVGVSLIQQENSVVMIDGERLRNYLEDCLKEDRSFDLLVKLDDEEEDKIGTETALLSSDFGDDKDIFSKRPALHFEIELDTPTTTIEEPFVFERSMEYVLPIQRHPDQNILLSTDLVSVDDGLPPTVWVRGGQTGVEGEWTRYYLPMNRRWDWSQVKLSAAPHRLAWGDLFSVSIPEPWVRPGPREKQLPEMLLIAPSGKIHRVNGHVEADLSYRIDFTPKELGLWRYGWSFVPTKSRRVGGQVGEGLFYVWDYPETMDAGKLKQIASVLVSSLPLRARKDLEFQVRLNNFIRLSSEYAQVGMREQQESKKIVQDIRKTLKKTIFEILREKL